MSLENVDVSSVDSGLSADLATVDTSNVLPELGNESEANETVETQQSEVSENEPQVVDEQVTEPLEEDEPLYVEEDLNVSKLNQFFKESPELNKLMQASPQVRNALYAMARRSTKLAEYSQVYPTIDAAKFAAQNSEQFTKFNDLFFSPEPTDAIEFWNNLHQNSFQKDPLTGEVITRNGQPVQTGAYQRVTGAYRNALYYDLGNIANQVGGDEGQKLIDAIETIRNYAGDSQRKLNTNELDPEVRRKLDEADEIINSSKINETRQSQEFEQKTASSIYDGIKEDISSRLTRMVKEQNLALTPYEQRNIVNDALEEINKIAGENQQYQTHFESLRKRAPLTEAGRQTLVTEARKYAKEILPSALLKVIREATKEVVEKAQTTQAKRASNASKKEVKTTGNAPLPAGPKSLKEKASQLREKLGRPLTEKEIFELN